VAAAGRRVRGGTGARRDPRPGHRGPAGVVLPVPEERLRRVLPASTADRKVRFFGVDLTGIQFRACDIDWALGSGTPLTGTAADLLLALCRRKLPPGRPAGEAAGQPAVSQNAIVRIRPRY
jgi:hypothetical protein